MYVCRQCEVNDILWLCCSCNILKPRHAFGVRENHTRPRCIQCGKKELDEHNVRQAAKNEIVSIVCRSCKCALPHTNYSKTQLELKHTEAKICRPCAQAADLQQRNERMHRLEKECCRQCGKLCTSFTHLTEPQIKQCLRGFRGILCVDCCMGYKNKKGKTRSATTNKTNKMRKDSRAERLKTLRCKKCSQNLSSFSHVFKSMLNMCLAWKRPLHVQIVIPKLTQESGNNGVYRNTTRKLMSGHGHIYMVCTAESVL